MPSFEDTVRFIQQAHEGQTDKSGEPYWKHPVAVASIVASLYNGNEDEQLAALLHDVLEDTPITKEQLAELGYSPATIEMVRWVSNNETRGSMTYLEWIQYIADNAPLGSLKLKISDNQHNTRPGAPPGLVKRYHKSMAILRDALDSRG
jgi:(p)ppGpp synthase/HD superfamily hydrolase